MLAACTGPRPSTGPPAVVTTPPRVTPSASAVPDWGAFAGQLQGRLLRKGDTGYVAAARLYNSRFDASEIEQLLSDAGIRSTSRIRTAHRVEVLVFPEDADRARALAASFPGREN